MPADSVYANPSLPYVIAVLAFATVVSRVGIDQLAEASRNLALGRVTQMEIAAQIARPRVHARLGILQPIDLGAGRRGTICGRCAHGPESCLVPGSANRWHWDSGAFAEIFHFGKWIFASSILGFLVSSSDRLVLGWMVDSSVLGVYAIAYLMFSAVEQIVCKSCRHYWIPCA